MLMTTVWRKGRSAGENCGRDNTHANMDVLKDPGRAVARVADLEAQTAAIEAGLVHGAVLLHELAAQLGVLQRVELAVRVVAEQLLRQMQEGSQLTQSVAVRLHLRGVVVRPEEGTVVVGGDITALVNDVEKTGVQNLKDRKQTTRTFSIFPFQCFIPLQTSSFLVQGAFPQALPTPS